MEEFIEQLLGGFFEGTTKIYYEVPGTEETLVIWVKNESVISVAPMTNESAKKAQEIIKKNYQKLINEAIENEDYEEASRLRDERNALDEDSGRSGGSDTGNSPDEDQTPELV